MGRTACTEPQCLYKGDLYLYLFSHERVELYLNPPYGPYGLYRASVSVQGCNLPFTLLLLNKRPSNTTIYLLCNAELRVSVLQGRRKALC
jgi:hypothetical protein